MKCLNPLKKIFFTVCLMRGGGKMFTWTKVAKKFDEMLKLTKKIFFHCLAKGGWRRGMACQATPTPPPPQTLTRKFSKSKKSSWLLGLWWWGVWHARPPPTTPKVSQENFLSPKSQVEFGGGGGYGMADHPPTPKFHKKIPKSQVEFGGGGGGMACHTTPPPQS